MITVLRDEQVSFIWFASRAGLCGSFDEQVRTAICIVPNAVPMREINVL
jgi:hypothetical protein